MVQVYTFAHDPQLAIYKRLIELDESSDTTAVWFHNPRGKADRYYSAKVSFQKVPKTEINAVESNEARMNFESDMQIYPIVDASATPLAFLTDLPATKTVASGAALDLAVVMQGGSAPYTYVWKKGSTAILAKPHRRSASRRLRPVMLVRTPVKSPMPQARRLLLLRAPSPSAKNRPGSPGSFMRIARAHQRKSFSCELGKPITFGGFAVRQAHA